MKQLMIELGFCSERSVNSDSNERVLLYDLWRILEGDNNDEVSVEDLRILIMTVVKITDYKRINVLPNDEEL